MQRNRVSSPQTLTRRVVDEVDLTQLLVSFIQPGVGRSHWLSATEANALVAKAEVASESAKKALKEALIAGLMTGRVGDRPLRLGRQAKEIVSRFTGVRDALVESNPLPNPPANPSPAAVLDSFHPGTTQQPCSPSQSSTAPDLASTPLGVRLGLQNARFAEVPRSFNSAKHQLCALIEQHFGVDLEEGITDLAFDRIEKGTLQIKVCLRDAMHYRLPLPNGEVAKIHVPRSPTGTALVLSVDLSSDQRGPVLAGVEFKFESWGLGGKAVPLANAYLPRIKNPAIFDENSKKWVKRRDNLAADVLFRGLKINAGGEVAVDGDIRILGGLRVDSLQDEMGALPEINVEVEKLAVGDFLAGQIPESPSRRRDVLLNTRDLLRSFSSMAAGGSWELSLDAGAARFQTEGEVAVGDHFRLVGSTQTSMSVAGFTGQLDVAVRNDGETADGAVTVSSQINSEAEGMIAKLQQSASWSKDGLALGGVEIDALFPTKIISPSLARGPKLGSAAFRKRIATLLDTAAPVTRGNQVRFLPSGRSVLDARLALINQAKPGQTLLLQTFIFRDDVTGGAVIDGLVAAKARGVEVRVLIDALGSLENGQDLAVGNKAYRRLRSEGVDVRLVSDPRDGLAAQVLKIGHTLAEQSPEAKLIEAGAPALAAVVRLLRTQRTEIAEALMKPKELVELFSLMVVAVDELKNGAVQRSLPRRTLAAFQSLFDGKTGLEVARGLIASLARDHRKRLVLFGTSHAGETAAEVQMGGNNTADDYLLSRDDPRLPPEKAATHMLWADADVSLKGAEVVAQEVADFDATWQKVGVSSTDSPQNSVDAPSPPLQFEPSTVAISHSGGLDLRLVHHRPIAAVGDETGDNHFTNAMIVTLEGMGRGDTMRIETPYFVPCPQLQDAMVIAAARGARIRVLTNGATQNNDARTVALHSRSFCLPRLVGTNGIEVFERKNNVDPVHQKSVIVDNARGEVLYMFGSQNMDDLSSRINKEMFLIGGTALEDSQSQEVIERGLFQDFNEDCSAENATKVELSDLKTTSFKETSSNYARSLLSPLL